MTDAAAPAPRHAAPRVLWLGVLMAVLVLLAALSVAIGTREVGLDDIAAALRGQVDTIEQAAVAARIPRTVLAALAGASLGMAGAIMQGVTRNPLADPGILGVNLGASLAIAVAVAWFGIASAQAYLTSRCSKPGRARIAPRTASTAAAGPAIVPFSPSCATSSVPRAPPASQLAWRRSLTASRSSIGAKR